MAIFVSLILEADKGLASLYNERDCAIIILEGWIDTVRENLDDFIQSIRKDTGVNFVDGTIHRFFGTKANIIERIKDKFFPSKITREIKRLNVLHEKLQETLKQNKK
jgi:hypothetical protein